MRCGPVSCIERGKRPILLKQCMAMAKALGLTDEEDAQRMLLACRDPVPARLKSILHKTRLSIRWHAFEVFLKACPQDKLPALLATLDTIAEI
jgi:hypothetical protein